MGYPIIDQCPACNSRDVEYQSATPIAGLTNVLYHCNNCGAFISRNEYSQPMVQYVVNTRTGRPIKLNETGGSRSQRTSYTGSSSKPFSINMRYVYYVIIILCILAFWQFMFF